MSYKKYERLQTNNLSDKRIQTSKETLTNQAKKIFRTINKNAIKTRVTYRQSTYNFIDYVSKNYGLMNIKNMDHKHIYQYVEYLIDEDYKPSTIKKDLSGLRYFYDLIPNPKMKDFPENETFNIDDRVAELEKTRALTTEEISKFEAVCKSLGRDDVLIASRLSRTLGLRINEVVVLKKDKLESALRTGYLDLKRGDGTKGGRPRQIPLNDESRALIKELNSQVKRGDYVVKSEQTGQRHTVKKSITNFMYNHRDKFQDKSLTKIQVNVNGEFKEIERNIRFHSFRYTYAKDRYNELIDKGLSNNQAELMVSQYLGHNRPEVTRRYL